ncbi:MAG: hypothetical protein NT169_06405 [Chloroflexi bacterium]|nr:hypothetical protein [Chloroflexota bacterium]
MTTPRGSTQRGEALRGRGLDALFDSTVGPAAGSQEVDADLASLLDNEVRAAQGSGAAPVHVAPVVTGGSRATEMPEVIDLPPLATAAQSVQPAEPPSSSPPRPTPAADTPAPEPERVLPLTKRFGAIIMDTEPSAAATPVAEETPLEVGPAGEIIEERPLPAVTPERLPAERSIMPPITGTPVTQSQPIVITPRPDDQKALILARLDKMLGPDWQQTFRQEIDDLYKQVATEFSSPPANADRAAGLLNEALQTLVENPEEYVAAKNRTIQVQTMLNRTRESRVQSGHFGPRILGYEVGWMFLFLLGLVFAAPLATGLGSLGKMSEKTMADLFPIWNTMMWGGIGGVIGALYTLWWHISDQEDFDRQYLMWYLVQPIMGLLLGGIVFLLLAGGFLILAVNLTDSADSTAGTRLLPYLAAVLAGFRQNFIYEQFDRMIALFGQGSKSQGGKA